MCQNQRLYRISMPPLPHHCHQFRRWHHSGVCCLRSQICGSLQAVVPSAVPTHWRHPQLPFVSSHHQWRFASSLQLFTCHWPLDLRGQWLYFSAVVEVLSASYDWSEWLADNTVFLHMIAKKLQNAGSWNRVQVHFGWMMIPIYKNW